MSVPAHSRRPLRAPIAAAAAVLALVAGVTAFALAVATPAPAEAPVVGGSVPSVLSLSLSQPTGFSEVAGARARRHAGRGEGRRESLYAATMTVAVTSTEAPTRLSIADGEASKIDHQLAQWNQPVSEQTATVRIAYRGSPSGLRRYHKLLLVTVTAGGP